METEKKLKKYMVFIGTGQSVMAIKILRIMIIIVYSFLF